MANVYKDSSGKWISQIQIGYYENGRPKFKRFKADTKKSGIGKKLRVIKLKQITSQYYRKMLMC